MIKVTMKDNDALVASGPEANGKRPQIKPVVPPRRNVSPCPNPSSNARKKVLGGDNPNVKKMEFPGESPTPDISFTPRATSSSANSLCSSASQKEETAGFYEKEKTTKSSDRPSVTFDPNPTILLTDSDGSPLKVSCKDGLKKPCGENAPPAISKLNQNPLSALKKADDLETVARMKPEEPEDCYLKELYEQINSVVASKPDEKDTANEDEAEDPAAVPMIWISKWVDYSDKYGLGYQLSDDSIGVLFNDFTKLLLMPDGDTIHYIERLGQEHYHHLTEYPEDLYKKVTLLRYFRNYMNEHLLKAGAAMSPREGDELARIPSLKTYFRTRSAIILHLTNGTLQINFFEDHTKIILCPLMGAVTYIDKKRFRTFRLSSLEQYGCSSDLANRLRYSRNMIQKLMLTKFGSKGSSSSATSQQVPSQTNKLT